MTTPVLKRVIRFPILTLLRAIEIVTSVIFVSKPYQALIALFDTSEIPHVSVRTAVVAHIYYLELWNEIVALRATLPAGSPIIATAPPMQAEELRHLTAHDPLVKIVEHPNRGRDIAPFLSVLQSGVLDPFDVVLKVHTKKSPHLFQGSLRRRVLFTALAGSHKVSMRVISLFQKADVGIIGPAGYFRTWRVYWMKNREKVENLAMLMGCEPGLGFFEGSMFWFRPSALSPLRSLDLPLDAFEVEMGQQDGTLHHAIERVFTIAAKLNGYETYSLQGRLLAPRA